MRLNSIFKCALVNAFILFANAEIYNVVVLPTEYGGTGAGVVIDDGTPIKMLSSVNGMLWSIEGNKPAKDYYYVVLNGDEVVYTEKENFTLTRKWTSSRDETFNQIFGRKYDKADSLLKTIPRIYPAPDSYKKYSKLFQEGEVPVMRVNLSEADYSSILNENGENRELEVVGTLDIITPDDVFQFTNITLSFGGMGTRGQKKHPYKINFSEGENDKKSNTEFYNRSSFKLRSCIYDTSFIKNKMAVDIAASMGLPSGQAAHARFYINNDPHGLFELSENLKKKYLRTYFHPGQKKSEITLGTYYKGVSTTDNTGLSYQAYLYPEPKELFSSMYTPSIVRQGAVDDLEDINEIINWIDSLTETTPESEIRAKFDVDMFLKYMTLEYLICQWDGYLLGGNNYYIYRKVDGTFSLMSFDYDLTFGKWQFYPPETEFHNFALSKKNYGAGEPIHSQLYLKLLTREPFKTQLKNIIDEVVSKLFNEDALKGRISYFKEFLNDDIIWETIVRPTLKTTLFNENNHIEDITYELSMSTFDAEVATDGEPSILSWIKARSEYISKIDGLTLKANYDNGEVGGIIEIDEEGETKVNGETISGNSKTLIMNTISLIMLSLAAFIL